MPLANIEGKVIWRWDPGGYSKIKHNRIMTMDEGEKSMVEKVILDSGCGPFHNTGNQGTHSQSTQESCCHSESQELSRKVFDAQACEDEETFPLYIEPTTAFDLKPSLAIKGSFDTGKLLLRVLRCPNQ